MSCKGTRHQRTGTNETRQEVLHGVSVVRNGHTSETEMEMTRKYDYEWEFVSVSANVGVSP